MPYHFSKKEMIIIQRLLDEWLGKDRFFSDYFYKKTCQKFQGKAALNVIFRYLLVLYAKGNSKELEKRI